MPREDTKAKLIQAVATLATDEGFKAWLHLRTQTSLGRYSLFNQLLIASQMPDATRVAGYKSWQRQGRQVRKGEHAIWILAPLKRTWTEPDEAGVERTYTKLMGFSGTAVFDVTQTDGPEIPSFAISPTGGTAEEWSLVSSATRRPKALKYVSSTPATPTATSTGRRT